MPASITHILVAEEAKRHLPQTVREAAERADDCYFLGAQGPDLFFFYRPLGKREQNLGKLLHRGSIYGWFTALLASLDAFSGKERDRCLAYALGFCTHLATDVAFHPFVYRYLEKYENSVRLHQKIENDWDVYFAKKCLGVSARGYRYPFDTRSIAREGVLFRYLSLTAQELGWTVTSESFARSLRLFGWFLTHFHKRNFRFFHALGFQPFYPAETPDPLFLQNEAFALLSGGKAQDADGVFSLAAEDSAAGMVAFFDALLSDMVLPKSFFARDLHTGKQIQGSPD